MEVRSPLKWFQLEPKWPPVKITAVRCWRTKTANCVCKFDWGRWSSLLLRREASRHCCHQFCVHRYSPTLCTAPLLAACNTHTTATVSQRNVAQPKHNQSGHLFAILSSSRCLVGTLWQCCFPLEISGAAGLVRWWQQHRVEPATTQLPTLRKTWSKGAKMKVVQIVSRWNFKRTGYQDLRLYCAM